jgi:hypothetical protein
MLQESSSQLTSVQTSMKLRHPSVTTRLALLLAGVGAASLATNLRASGVGSGYPVDTSLAAPVVSLSYSQDLVYFGSSSSFGTLTSPDTNISVAATGGLSGGALDPSVSASINEGFGTYLASASLTYEFTIIPPTPADDGMLVPVDISGTAEVTVGPEAFYDTAYAPTAKVTISGPGFSGTDTIADVNGLSGAYTPTTLATNSDPFDDAFSLAAGSVYTLEISTFVGYSADPPEDLTASVDPFAFMPPDFAIDHPGFVIAFPPGFPGGASSSGPGVPDAASTFLLLGLASGLVALFGGRRARVS